jgi:hypothetical protein
MRPGERVTLEIDAYPEREIGGHVDSVQPGSGTAFSLLPAQNATGNYVKIVQRVPVKIVMDDPQTDVALGPGMSVVPTVRVDPTPRSLSGLGDDYERRRERSRRSGGLPVHDCRGHPCWPQLSAARVDLIWPSIIPRCPALAVARRVSR